MHLSRRVGALLSHPLGPYLWALALQLVFSGYVKDDAYIEYRYATHLAAGQGLTFNVGDPPVEGFTSFLWTVALALPAALHLPLLAVAKVAGALALVGVIAWTGRWVRARGGDGEPAAGRVRADADQRLANAAQLGRWLAATNASLVVWAQSGMEPVLAAWLVLAGMTALDEERSWAGMLLLATAAGVRPECHVVLALGVVVAARRRAWAPLLVALALVALMHLFRWRYFGGLVPNTVLVKGGHLVWRAGLRYLGELMLTSLGGVVVLAALAEAWRRRDDVALACAAAIVAFAAYLVRIGKDEMFLVRLFLPVWPLAIGLAAPLLARAWRDRRLRVVPLAVAAVGIGFTCSRLFSIGHRALGERSHGALATLMKAHAQPGDLVVFQDLGQTPWSAMELRFVDPIGLVEPVVARLRWAERSSPFLGQPSPATQAKIRDRLFALEPRLVAFVAYVPDDEGRETRRRAEAAAGQPAALERVFGWFVDRNPYHVGMHADPRFARYRLVDVVRRKDNYWFVLYERGV
jgi:hypothetical protein